jgi:hypothetical protein
MNVNRPARLNRFLIGLVGLVVLVGGLFVLGTGLGVLHWLPAGGAVLPTGTRLLSWVPWVAAVAAIIVGLLCVRWLAAQAVRRPKTRTWSLEDDPGQGVTRMAADTATDPFVADVRDCDGVTGASAWLVGSRTHPVLHVTVATGADTDLGQLRRQIVEHAVARLRQALELDDLPVMMQFRFGGSRTR